MSRRHDSNRDRSRERHGYRGRSQSPPDVQSTQRQSNEKKKKSNHQSSRYSTVSRPEGKRVKFNDVPDIKVFRKQDEPNTKGLTETDIEEYMKKIESQRGSNFFASSNWQKMKHFDAQLQNNSIKEQKQKEKILHDKLQGVKQQIPFYTPLILRLTNMEAVKPGECSLESSSLSERLYDVLGCNYPEQVLIPAEPIFQIQNKSASVAPKHISFDKQRMNNKDFNTNKKVQKKDQKPLKGILKMTPEERARERSQSAPRRIDPELINLLKQMQINKAAYPKQRAEMLLKRYKDSGELDYLKNNPNVLTELMRGVSVSNSVERTLPNTAPLISSSGSSKPISLPDPYKPRYSVSPQPQRPPQQEPVSHDMGKPMPSRYDSFDPNQPQPGGYNPSYAQPNKFYSGYPPNYRPQPQPQYGGYNPPQIQPIQPLQPMYGQNPNPNPNPYPAQSSFGYPPAQNQPQQQQSQYMANRNYKTVPCKYFHSPQGCVKSNGCTFIHDQQFAGRPTPSMLKSNRGMVMTSYGPGQGDPQQGYYQGYAPDYQRQ